MHSPHLLRSISDPETFWAEEARRIDWQVTPTRILDASDPVRPAWFAGGLLNLCHNAVDRHLPLRSAQNALVYASAISGIEATFTYAELHREVNAMAAVMQDLGVTAGDRVLLHLPVTPEAVFAMLACVRLGAIHNVVFAGFPAQALAHRIDDVTPVLIVSAGPRAMDATGNRQAVIKDCTDCTSGVEQALALSTHQPAHHLDITACALRSAVATPATSATTVPANAGSAISASPDAPSTQRHTYAPLRAAALGRLIPCVWVESAAPSYILHTSGTTGKPKGIVRDTGGHAVALASTLAYQFELHAGDTLFSTSDLGWVVGHSYGVYAPLIGGLTTVLYEGSAAYRVPDMLWRLAARHRVNAIVSAPTVMRAQRGGVALARTHDLSHLRAVYLAGEPLDMESAKTLSDAIGKPVIDHYWQTETGSPILAAGRPVQGFNVQVHLDPADQHSTRRDANATATATATAAPHGIFLTPSAGMRQAAESGIETASEYETQAEAKAGQRGLVCLVAPLPPGCLLRLWNDDIADTRLRATYWTAHKHTWVYQTSDWGCADATQRIALSGRADDTINIAGQRIGTREIEETLRGDPRVIDVAVLGFSDKLRGQVPLAFVVMDRSGLDLHFDEAAWCATLARRAVTALGRAARPRRVVLVTALPRTRSGKVVRRMMRDMLDQIIAPDHDDLPSAQTLSAVLDLRASAPKQLTY